MKSKWMFIATLLCFFIIQVGCQTAQSHKVTKSGFICNFNTKGQTFDFDEVEWIGADDTKRIEELHLENEGMPNGFYIYNHDKHLENYRVTDKTIYQLLNWNDLSKLMNVNIEEFSKYLEKYKDPSGIPYMVTVQNGNAIVIQERYVP